MSHTTEKTTKAIICAVVDNGTVGVRLGGNTQFAGQNSNYIRFTKLFGGTDKPTGEVAVCVNNSASIQRVSWKFFTEIAEFIAHDVKKLHS